MTRYFKIDSNFRPHPVLRGAHAQTLGGAYLWRPLPYTAIQHQVALDDGDKIVLHDDQPIDWNSTDRIVLLCHGLAGCHGSGYMQRIAAKLVAIGVRVYRMDMRGFGAGIPLARHAFHAGRIQDIHAALNFIHEQHASAPIMVAGFSLGGGMLLKLFGSEAFDDLRFVDRIVAVAPPIDLKRCSMRIGKGFSQLYDRAFTRTLLKYVRERIARSDSPNLPLDPKPQTLYEFDERITAPLGGFSSVDEYYSKSSALPALSQIRVPTLIITAEDDPLVPVASFRDADCSPKIQLCITKAGGHVGYVGSPKNGDADWHWMDWRVVDAAVQS